MGNSQQDLAFNKNEDQMKLKVSKLNNRLNEIYKGGGKKKIDKHHSKGKLTARERIDLLLDKKSNRVEVGAFAGYKMYLHVSLK